MNLAVRRSGCEARGDLPIGAGIEQERALLVRACKFAEAREACKSTGNSGGRSLTARYILGKEVSERAMSSVQP